MGAAVRSRAPAAQGSRRPAGGVGASVPVGLGRLCPGYREGSGGQQYLDPAGAWAPGPAVQLGPRPQEGGHGPTRPLAPATGWHSSARLAKGSFVGAAWHSQQGTQGLILLQASWQGQRGRAGRAGRWGPRGFPEFCSHTSCPSGPGNADLMLRGSESQGPTPAPQPAGSRWLVLLQQESEPGPRGPGSGGGLGCRVTGHVGRGVPFPHEKGRPPPPQGTRPGWEASARPSEQ